MHASSVAATHTSPVQPRVRKGINLVITVLTYTFVTSDEDDGVLTVGFADNQFNTQAYLLFQTCLDVEAEAENSDVYVERNGQQQGTYGGIKRIVLLRDQALLSLSSETADILGTGREVKVLFSTTDEQFQQLRNGSQTVFARKQMLEVRQ